MSVNTNEMRTHTCYVEILAERGGDIVLVPFAKPNGGPEGLAEVGKILKRWLAHRAQFSTDACFAYIGHCKDNPEDEIFHMIVNHSQTDEFGFV